MLSGGERAQAETMEAMFRRIAPCYDRVNRVISLGQDKAWRRRALAAMGPRPQGVYLDLACGSGEFTLALAAVGGRAVGLDLCSPMLRRAGAKARRDGIGGGCRWLVGHALCLPFRPEAFDGVTIGFALRNIPNLPRLFQECHRVLKPGGRLVCLELGWGEEGRVGSIYRLYLFHLVPALGRWLSGDGDAYRYLPRSLLPFLRPTQLARLVAQAGFPGVSCRPLSGGAVVLLTAEKSHA